MGKNTDCGVSGREMECRGGCAGAPADELICFKRFWNILFGVPTTWEVVKQDKYEAAVDVRSRASMLLVSEHATGLERLCWRVSDSIAASDSSVNIRFYEVTRIRKQTCRLISPHFHSSS